MRIRRTLVTLLPLLMLARLQDTRSTDDEAPAQAAANADIRRLLERQQQAWNRGDIPGFMDGYVHSEKLRFASGSSVRRGWDATLKRYQASYPTAEAMGRLAFEDLEIRLLAPQWAEVFGRYRLTRAGEFGNATGLFTLLVRRTPDGWRVLHNHTSSAKP